MQAQTVGARTHVSTQVRRHAERHVLCDDGHSRHVVVHWAAGAHAPAELHQPQPGASAAREQTSVARPQTAGEEMLSAMAAPAGVIGGRAANAAAQQSAIMCF